eukprot:INCI19247.1.p1 GENE.INCI19247.1~~INCI19247.1.p1  ORF type:complete len:324 (-),score=62.67 INCI19247.1:84-1055(-)
MGIFSTRNAVAFVFALGLAVFQISRHWGTIMDQGGLKREEFAHAQATLARSIDRRKYRTVLVSSQFGKDPTGIVVMTLGRSPNVVAAELVLTAKMKNPLAKSSSRSPKAAMARRSVAQRNRQRSKSGAKSKGKVIGRHALPHKQTGSSKRKLRDIATMKFFFHLQVYDSELEHLRDIFEDENLLPHRHRTAGGSGHTPFSAMGERESYSDRKRREEAERAIAEDSGEVGAEQQEEVGDSQHSANANEEEIFLAQDSEAASGRHERETVDEQNSGAPEKQEEFDHDELEASRARQQNVQAHLDAIAAARPRDGAEQDFEEKSEL